MRNFSKLIPDLRGWRKRAWSWLGWAWGWLEHAGKRAWILVLCVSLGSLYVAIVNYRFQMNANVPHLLSSGSDIVWDANLLRFQWNNVGKAVAREGKVSLFALRDDGSDKQPLGDAPIIGGGTNIFPGYGASANLKVDITKILGQLLACVTFIDEQGTMHEEGRSSSCHPKI